MDADALNRVTSECNSIQSVPVSIHDDEVLCLSHNCAIVFYSATVLLGRKEDWI